MTTHDSETTGETDLIKVTLPDGVPAALTRTPDGAWLVEWSDGVANEWREEYGHLSVALLRLGNLAACGESDWGKYLTKDEGEFAYAADLFLQEATGG